MIRPSLLFLVLVATSSGPAAGQTPPDSLLSAELDELVVTADRAATLRRQTTAAVSVVPAAEFRRMAGINGLSDVLRQVPGLAMVHTDGLGYAPQSIVRGFYGGGEAEYLLILVDGQPLNVMETGLVNWDQLPLIGIKSVEILRGGASSLYGDAAIGGIVNLVTDDSSAPARRVATSGGSFGALRVSGAIRGRVLGRATGFHANVDRTSGFRENAGRMAMNAGFRTSLLRQTGHSLVLNTSLHTRSTNVSGPLTVEQISRSRTQESVFHRFDSVDESIGRFSLQSRLSVGMDTYASTTVTGNWRSSAVVRTLPLSAEFADTKQRDLSTSRVLISHQWVTPVWGLNDRLTTGIDGQISRMDHTWYDMLTGGESDYEASDGTSGGSSTEGQASRRAFAAYAQYELNPVSQLRIALGARYDRIIDKHTPAVGDDAEATHTALSPKAGINVRYVSSPSHVGHWYANVARSFKAATLDQLFDQRLIPVPFPPFQITIANHELKPQHGVSLETGWYHRAALIPGSLSGELTLSLYHMDMTDELDFQFETFQYANIAKSRHRGAELGAVLDMEGQARLQLSYTLQHVTYRAGAYEGNFIRAIPRHFTSLSVRVPLTEELTASTSLRAARRTWLDDLNTVALDDYNTIDIRLTYTLGRHAVQFEATNLLDRLYSSTGYSDMSNTIFLYPAAGRGLRAGLVLEW